MNPEIFNQQINVVGKLCGMSDNYLLSTISVKTFVKYGLVIQNSKENKAGYISLQFHLKLNSCTSGRPGCPNICKVNSCYFDALNVMKLLDFPWRLCLRLLVLISTTSIIVRCAKGVPGWDVAQNEHPPHTKIIIRTLNLEGNVFGVQKYVIINLWADLNFQN